MSIFQSLRAPFHSFAVDIFLTNRYLFILITISVLTKRAYNDQKKSKIYILKRNYPEKSQR